MKRLLFDIDRHCPTSCVAEWQHAARYAGWCRNEIKQVLERCRGLSLRDALGVLREHSEPTPEFIGKRCYGSWDSKAFEILAEYWHKKLNRYKLDYSQAVHEIVRDLQAFGELALQAIGGEWDFRSEESDKRYDEPRSIANPLKVFMVAAARRIVPSRFEWEVLETNGGDVRFVITRERA